MGPFETTIEGDYDELMDIVKECQHIAVKAGCPALMSYVKSAISLTARGALPLTRKLRSITTKLSAGI